MQLLLIVCVYIPFSAKVDSGEDRSSGSSMATGGLVGALKHALDSRRVACVNTGEASHFSSSLECA